MIDKELPEKRNRNPLKRLVKAAVPVITTGIVLTDNNPASVEELTGSVSPSNTPVSEANGLPSFQDLEKQLTKVESPEVIQLKHSLMEKFGIELHTFDEISDHPETKLFYGFQNILPVNQEWNEANLTLLKNAFDYIPEDFYKPEDGAKVHVILGPTSHCGYDIKGFTPKYPYEIMLSYQMFSPKNPLTSILVVAHEFGHLKTTESCSSPLNPNYIDKLEELTGQDFEQIQKELPGQIEERADELGVKIEKTGFFKTIDTMTPEEENSLRLTRLNYATKNSKEFMAVLFESYFLGKEYFYRMYEPFFGEPKTTGFYNMIKEIYQGREFQDYQTTSSELKK